jgi:hypothetical protein
MHPFHATILSNISQGSYFLKIQSFIRLKSISLEFGQALYLTPEMDPGILTSPIPFSGKIISDFQRFLLSIRPGTFPESITNEKGRVKNSLCSLQGIRSESRRA